MQVRSSQGVLKQEKVRLVSNGSAQNKIPWSPTKNKGYASIVLEERQLQFTQGMDARPFVEGSAFKVSAAIL